MEQEYLHGGDGYGHLIELDFSANLNPYGLPLGVKQAIKDGIEQEACSLYPDSFCRKLRQALAEFYGISKDHIICGNGAADLIYGLAAAVRPKRGLVMGPSFSEYASALAAAGCEEVHTFYLSQEEGFCLNVSRLTEQVQKAAKEGIPYDVVFLCNPNNPTGLSVKKEDMLLLISSCALLGTVVVVDECFCGFLDRPWEVSALSFVKEYSNLFLLNAFTKLYAMAGLRLGYGVCRDTELLERIRRVRQPWPVSGLAQKAGIAALLEQEYVERTRRLIKNERLRMIPALKELGFKVYPSEANYLFFQDRRNQAGGENGEEAGTLYHWMLLRKVLLRNCANYQGLDGSYYRICIKREEENDKLLCLLRQWIRET